MSYALLAFSGKSKDDFGGKKMSVKWTWVTEIVLAGSSWFSPLVLPSWRDKILNMYCCELPR
jgi:hypothetical protein